jgi:hypothetical protein
MGAVEEFLSDYGKKTLNVEDAKEAFRLLYEKEGKSLEDIAKMMGKTRQAVAYVARKMGFSISKPGRPPVIRSRVEQKGFPNVADYFKASGKKTFASMAEELQLSTSTIQRYYAEFLRENAGIANP